MKTETVRQRVLASTVLFVALVATAVNLVASDRNLTKTIENLQAAYNGESNAHAKYLAFAKRADEEGYRGVASLFRAAARSEAIHMKNHAEVIRKLGAEPRADVKEPVIRTTYENLEASANKGEAYERDVLYPKFIKRAEKDNVHEAAQTFKFARDAEEQHFILFHKAMVNLKSMKSAAITYYVCSVCGFTTDNPQGENCPDCGETSESYEAIS